MSIKKWPQTGFGFDAHLFGKGGQLVLGGEKISGVPQLKGHSDADALLHAVIDALLGAAALGDIGEHFPDTNPRFKGVSSQKLLADVVKKVEHQGFKVYFLDVTIVADRPKLSPYKVKIREILAKSLHLSVKSVNVKAKTSEGTQMFPKSGGIAAWAVATLVPKK